VIALVGLVPALPAAPPPDDRALVDSVNSAIDKGRQYLRRSRKGKNWDVLGSDKAGGVTALVMLALLSAGEKPSSEYIQDGLEYLRSINSGWTYVVSLQTMVYAAVGDPRDSQRLRNNVDWLLKGRKDFPEAKGWGYNDNNNDNWVDYSNTQYALLALHEAIVAGVKIDHKDLEWIRQLYVDSQSTRKEDGLIVGGWGYQKGKPPTYTMTVAGACGLLITGMDLNVGREKIDGKTVQQCGVYEAQTELDQALRMIGKYTPSTPGGFGAMPQHLYYSLYGVERLGRLSGQRFLGGKDWYRIGCEFLVGSQNHDEGFWSAGDGEENGPATCTAFALLFLSKGRTPVLISKFAHDANVDGNDWNNDHYDVRNLAEFARKELFAKPNQPAPQLAWQVFDPRLVEGDNDATVKRLAEELLQTPVVVLTGHVDPHLATGTGLLTRNGKILREYIENGGFLYVEACCGDPRFQKQIEDQISKLFPRGTKLEDLDANHPVWSASNKWVSYPKDFKLKGVQHGCRTPVIYSPDNLLCCQWEINDFENSGQKAFRMGANIIAYATGLTPPPQRGTRMHLTEAGNNKPPPPGSFKIAQILHDSKSPPAPNAVRNMMLALRAAGLKDIDLEPKLLYFGVEKAREEFADYKFLYMHGRTPIEYDKEDVAALTFSLEHNGTLFADACCGNKIFDDSFRKFVKDLFPDKKLEPIPLDDRLFSADLNGEKIDKVRCRRTTDNKDPENSYPLVEPELEGIKIGNKWAVIYSKYDIGCALEKHRSSNCLGHDHESAKRLAMAAALYALRP
jgi:hypothetical protein